MDVRWSLFAEDGADPVVADHTTSLCDDPWAEQPEHAATTISMILDDFFNHEKTWPAFSTRDTWKDLFGEDWSGRVEVAVTEPQHLAGRWLIYARLKADCLAAPKGEAEVDFDEG